jgi:(S)-3,5-dihydroxyphenylglycine transaminase
MGLEKVDMQVRTDRRLEVMNFLNEVAAEHPQAISFASGRPAEKFFAMDEWLARVPQFVQHFAHARAIDVATAYGLLAQYGRTNGIVNDLIAQQLGKDEGIVCRGSQIIVSAGCQEAIELCVRSLCTAPGDVVLVRSPCYIGITGVADLNRIELVPFTCDEPEQFAHALGEAIAAAQQRGKSPRALYLTPEFDNPTGTVLPRATREQVIAVCAANGIVVLEDNPYGMFRYEGTSNPTMFALDKSGCVIYLGTYSKTLCPALRVGFALVPERLFGDAARASALLAQLSQLKSFVTVNTSQIMQAMLGGVLLAENGSLARMAQPARQHYQDNRDRMLDCLASAFAGQADVRWNTPAGGFFLTVSLPFDFTQHAAEICARDYDVLVMPLAFFALNRDHDRHVRLAFSNVARDSIEAGIDRFARFVKNRLQAG